MSLDNIATPSHRLTSSTEIWGHVLFWCFLLSMLIYSVAGIYIAMTAPLLRKRLRLLIAVLCFVYGLIRLVFVEVLASGFLAGIYVTSGWAMTTGVAVAWGLGISLGANALSVLVSRVPLYGFL